MGVKGRVTEGFVHTRLRGAVGLPPARVPATSGTRAERPARGPMRPAQLATSRRRLKGPALSRRFQAVDIALITLAAALSVTVLGPASDPLDLPLRIAAPVILQLAALLTAAKAVGAYDFPGRETLAQHALKVSATALIGLAAGWIAALVAHADRGMLARIGALQAAVIAALHGVYLQRVHRWRSQGRLTPNLFVVGATPNARRLIEGALESGDAAILGVFDDRMSRIPPEIHGVPVLGDTEALLTHRLLPYVDHIVITVTPGAQKRVREIIDRLRPLPNAVTLFLDYEGAEARRRALSRLADAPLTQVAGAAENDTRAAAKRIQDLVIATSLLVALAPLLAVIAALVRLSGEGPIIFRQRRYGFNNEIIEVLKFRTMTTGPEALAAARQVVDGDERITPVGRWLRRLSLDELPQLVNVVAGEMSLVGPRPHAVGMKAAGMEAALLVGDYAWRHRMKPGLTGWAQVNGSVGPVDTPELVRRRVALDVEYIERQSFWFDLAILLLTVPALIRSCKITR